MMTSTQTLERNRVERSKALRPRLALPRPHPHGHVGLGASRAGQVPSTTHNPAQKMMMRTTFTSGAALAQWKRKWREVA